MLGAILILRLQQTAPSRGGANFSDRHHDAHRYADAMREMLRAVRASGIPTELLIDISKAQTMPQVVAQEMQSLADDICSGAIRKVAFVSSSAIAVMQARRIFGNRVQIMGFADGAVARTWLTEPE